jgi:hypothetical protein
MPWHIDFNYIDYRNGILTYAGDIFDMHMVVDEVGELLFGNQALSYFAEYGVPYEELCMLYELLLKHEEFSKKLWGRIEDPLYIIYDILRANKIADKKKKK